MQLFFSNELDYDIAFLDKSESFHASKVMRLRKGDEIYLTNGRGMMARAVLITSHPDDCEAKIVERMPMHNQRSYFLHVALALPKNPERLDWFVEKATELGVDEITPIICSRSNRDQIRIDRVTKIMVAAAKQSKQAFFPMLNTAIELSAFVEQPFHGTKIITHCEEGNKTSLSDLVKKNSNDLVLVGPEGDFTEEEIQLTMQAGFKPCSLGDSILRIETAGVFVCSAYRLINL